MEPTVQEMADFLVNAAKGKGKGKESKGGIKGLELLRFKISDRHDPGLWIRAAFTSFYDHLDAHLTAADKAELHFGAMFVEHLLCKISRYQSIFLKDPLAGTVTLVSLGEIAQQKQGSGWVSGANALDCTKFPIPLNVNRDELKASIVRVEVCNLYAFYETLIY